MFDIEKKDRILLFTNALVGSFAYIFMNDIIQWIVSVVFILVCFYVKKELSFASFYIANAFIDSPVFLCVGYIFVLIPGLMIMHEKNFKIRPFLFFSLIFFVLCTSFILGYQTSLPRLTLVLICFFMFLVVRYNYSRSQYGILIYGMFMAALLMLTSSLIKFLIGQDTLINQRLSFDGHISVLASACLIPMMYLTTSLFSGTNFFSHMTNKRQIFLLSYFFVGMLFTASRGTLTAFLLCAGISFLMIKNTTKKIYNIIFLVVFAVVFFVVISNNDNLDLNRIFVDNRGGFNGRSDIWGYYLSCFFNSDVARQLFGFGPGDIRRLSVGTIFFLAYPHSTYLDILISHGFVGIILFALGLCNVVYKVLIIKSNIWFPFLVGLLTCYSVHGTVFNPELYINLAIVSSMSGIMLREKRCLFFTRRLA
jgi:hypothetical protein